MPIGGVASEGFATKRATPFSLLYIILYCRKPDARCDDIALAVGQTQTNTKTHGHCESTG